MIKGKILESFKSIYPIALIVVILAVTLTPISAGDMLLFLMGVPLPILPVRMPIPALPSWRSI